MTNPYAGLPDYQFWRRAVASVAPGQLDPVVRAQRIRPDEKIVTMGSCFAQHFAHRVARSGFNYFVPEQPPHGSSPDSARALGYGVFSARYGNVYTPRQALQLVKRSLAASDDRHIWRHGDRYVDGFRPQVEPGGFASHEAAVVDRERHLTYARRVFSEGDWLLFTLGGTEAWRSKHDGAVFPLAPGVAGGMFSDAEHEFVSFTSVEIARDLEELVKQLARVNPRLRLIVTVSPVPMIATYENRHVCVANTLSKAALRVAADELERAHQNVFYFPAYEVITSPANTGRYFCDDLRGVTEQGVNHVWRVFAQHFLNEAVPVGSSQAALSAELGGEPEIACDEDDIERGLTRGTRIEQRGE